MTWQESVADLLGTRIGLEVASVGSGVIEAAVRKRMAASGLDATSAYCTRLVESTAEQRDLIEEVVVPESWFFRDGRPFRRLQEHVRAQWLFEASEYPVLRVLSLPCAGGEEPYSIAIALREVGVPPDRIQIDAVDISSRALDRARQGVYGPQAFRGPEFGDSRRCFRPHPAGLEVDPDVRARVHFQEGNLLDADLLADQPPYDVIFCRNLLIYLTDRARRRAVDALDRLLADDGILFVGHAEALSLLEPRFTADGDRGSFAYRRSLHAAPPGPVQASGGPRLSDGRRVADGGLAFATAAPPTPLPSPLRGDGRGESTPTRVMAADGMVSAALLDQATEHANRQEHEQAIRLCERALQLHGPAPRTFLLLGMIELARGRLDQAEASLHKAVYLDGQEDEALLALALICERRGDEEGASRFQRRAERARRIKEAP
jgi:chemotaxis protein methyltransferase WspC